MGALSPETWGMMLAIVAGALKEIWDWISGKGKPELGDAVATALGGILGWLLRKIIG